MGRLGCWLCSVDRSADLFYKKKQKPTGSVLIDLLIGTYLELTHNPQRDGWPDVEPHPPLKVERIPWKNICGTGDWTKRFTL